MMRRRTLSGIALALTVALASTGCVVSAPEAPGDAVTAVVQPVPGSGAVVPTDAPIPPEVSMCTTTPSPSGLPAPGQMVPGTTMADIQDELPLDYDEDEGEPLPFDRPANVDAETGEVYEVITDEARMIGDGE